jgi:hypothetical protein
MTSNSVNSHPRTFYLRTLAIRGGPLLALPLPRWSSCTPFLITIPWVTRSTRSSVPVTADCGRGQPLREDLLRELTDGDFIVVDVLSASHRDFPARGMAGGMRRGVRYLPIVAGSRVLPETNSASSLARPPRPPHTTSPNPPADVRVMKVLRLIICFLQRVIQALPHPERCAHRSRDRCMDTCSAHTADGRRSNR